MAVHDPRVIGPVFRVLTTPGRLLWRLLTEYSARHLGEDPEDPSAHLFYTAGLLLAASALVSVALKLS